MLKLKRSFDTYSDNNTNNNNTNTNNNTSNESYNISRQPMESDYEGQSKKFRNYHQQQQQQYQQQVQQRSRSEYQFFNNVQSPIDEILDKIKNTEPIRLNKQHNINQQQQIQQNVNNNNNINININNNNNQINHNNQTNNIINTNNQQVQQRLFTLEEVQEIVRKAVKENEETIKAEYERIVKEKLIEQYQCFSKYNDDYLSRQMKESEYSYIS